MCSTFKHCRMRVVSYNPYRSEAVVRYCAGATGPLQLALSGKLPQRQTTISNKLQRYNVSNLYGGYCLLDIISCYSSPAIQNIRCGLLPKFKILLTELK